MPDPAIRCSCAHPCIVHDSLSGHALTCPVNRAMMSNSFLVRGYEDAEDRMALTAVDRTKRKLWRLSDIKR